MSMQKIREEIDRIDDELVETFARRMNAVSKIAKVKAEGGTAVAHPDREREIILRTTGQVPENLSGYTRILMNNLFDLSRSYQRQLMREGEAELVVKIKTAVSDTPKVLPQKARVACQGIAGAYSQLSCDKLFPMADIMYFKSFEGVFSAVEKGMCQYGMLPIENSTYGAVSEVYDLLRSRDVYIVRGTKLQISHALLANSGAKMEGIKEIVSHEQALGQCSEFLAAHPDIKITVYENTATAARIVAESGRLDLASISSPECAGLYELNILDENVRNESGNYTRFICISRNMEVYPGADKMSLMLTTEHRPGALYSVIAKLASLGVNLSKLESRPIPGRDFEFMFYLVLDASVYSEEVLSLLGDMSEGTEMFRYLGAYSEV
jgi:Prephenate dehydratase